MSALKSCSFSKNKIEVTLILKLAMVKTLLVKKIFLKIKICQKIRQKNSSLKFKFVKKIRQIWVLRSSACPGSKVVSPLNNFFLTRLDRLFMTFLKYVRKNNCKESKFYKDNVFNAKGSTNFAVLSMF